MQCDQKCDEQREDAAMDRDRRVNRLMTSAQIATADEVISQYQVDRLKALDAIADRSTDTSRPFRPYDVAHDVCAKLERGADPHA